MSVKINIVDSNLQITKRNTDGTISENLEWETPDGFPINGSKGQILANTGTDWVQLAVGANNYVLTADSSQTTGLKWAAASGGGTGLDIFDITDYGAVGDGVTDDGPAIQAAINAAMAANGGHIYFPTTTASWRIKTPILAVATANYYPTIVFCGELGAGPIRVAGSSAITGFELGSFGSITFENLSFIEEAGDPGVSGAGLITQNGVAHNLSFVVRNCHFYGISATTGIIVNPTGILSAIYDCHFGGCSAPAGFVVGIRSNGGIVKNCSFIDYASFRGTYYSKTPSGVYAWIGSSADYSAMTFDSMGYGAYVVDQCRFDEGCQYAVFHYNSAYATSLAPGLVVKNCNHLQNAVAGWFSVFTRGVLFTRIENCYFKPQSATSGAVTSDYGQRTEIINCWAQSVPSGSYYPVSQINTVTAIISNSYGFHQPTIMSSCEKAEWEWQGKRGEFLTAAWGAGPPFVAFQVPVKMSGTRTVTYMTTTDSTENAIGACALAPPLNGTATPILMAPQELYLQADSSGIISAGDFVGNSSSDAGCCRKVTTGYYYGICTKGAVALGTVTVMWRPGKL